MEWINLKKKEKKTAPVLNIKISEVENKILDVSSFVTTTALSTKIGEAENRILDFSGLVKKTVYNAKPSDNILLLLIILTSKVLEMKIKEKRLVDKCNFSIVKNSDLNTKLAILAAEVESKAEQDKTRTVYSYM